MEDSMTKPMGREASRFIEQALLEERLPTPNELASVRRSLLRAAAAMTATTGAAPLAAQTLAAKIAWFGAIGKASFVGAIVVGMSVGTVAIGGGTWLARRVEQPKHAPAARAGSASVTRSVALPGVSNAVALQPGLVLEASNIGGARNEQVPGREVVMPVVANGRPGGTVQPSAVAQPGGTVQPVAGRDVAARPRSPTLVDSQSAPAPTVAPPTSAAVARFAPVGHASLSNELAQLEEAQRAVSRGEAAKALTLLDRLNANVGSAGLVEERLALEALAACQTGQYDRGRRAEQKLLQRSPNSPLAGRIRGACGPEGHR
jgi:hypothetical protein